MRRSLTALALALALISGCNLQRGEPTAIPTPNLPTVTFSFPLDGSAINEGTDLAIEIVARDDTAGVARVELLLDDLPHEEGAPLDANAVPVFTVRFNWVAQQAGLHSLTAIAYRPDGTASTPTTIRINVLRRE